MGGFAPPFFLNIYHPQKPPELPSMARKGHGARPETTQHRAIEQLVAGRSIRAVAEDLSISEATLDQWLRDADFREQLLEASRAIHDRAMVKLSSAQDTAVEKLISLIADADSKVSLRAIELTLTLGTKWLERDVEQRIKRLEEILSEQLNQKS